MNPTKLTTKLEGFRTRNSTNHCYVNKDIYRILYSRELYYIAYNKSNPMMVLRHPEAMVHLFMGFAKNGLMN